MVTWLQGRINLSGQSVVGSPHFYRKKLMILVVVVSLYTLLQWQFVTFALCWGLLCTCTCAHWI